MDPSAHEVEAAVHPQQLLVEDGTAEADQLLVVTPASGISGLRAPRAGRRVAPLALGLGAALLLAAWAASTSRSRVPQTLTAPEGPAPIGLQAVVLATARLVQTVQDPEAKLQWLADVPLEPDFGWDGACIHVQAAPDGNPLLGFGGAFTEASAVVFNKLNAELQEELLEKYFGADGLNYVLGRVHINSCDFSEGNYAFDDITDDFQLLYFDDSLARDGKALIPLIQRAKARVEQAGAHTFQLLATPWSPPAWMKTNGQMDQSAMPGLRPECHDVWARYIARWVAAYKNHGIPIWAITVQNEPMQNSAFESCELPPEIESAFLAEHLGPTMAQQHPEVSIFIFDHNKEAVFAYANAVMQNPVAAQYTQGVAFHWYTGDHFEAVQQLHQAWPQKVLLASEATYEKHRWKPDAAGTYDDWTFGEGYAHDIIGDLNAGASGWIDWNLLLDVAGGPNHVGNMCDAAMIGDYDQQKLWLHPQYFYIAHFSKFMPPGSLRLASVVERAPRYGGGVRAYGTCTGEDGLESTSLLRPDQQVATVVLNCGNQPQDFKLQIGSCAIRAHIPAHAIQTYVYNPAPCAVAPYSK